MTLIGKLLIFLNLGLSMMCAVWAVGVYANRVDWSAQPAKGEEPAGKLREQQDRLEAARKELEIAFASWKGARDELMQAQAQRALDHDWYAQQLKHVRSEATAANPVKYMIYDPGAAGRPKEEPARDRAGKPLESLAAYGTRSDSTRKELENIMDAYRKNIDDDIRLTEELTGTADRKGLHQRLVDERAKQQGLVAEQRLEQPLLIIATVDQELIERRREGLDERLRELKDHLQKRNKAGVAARWP
jgi:hypothetical protein